jgi:cation diffusion facilitator CzcD-associated flavoprotein CzcO
LRTPPWVLPRNDRPTSARRRALYRLLPAAQRLARARIYWRREMLALGFLRATERLHAAEPLARRFLARQIADPALRAALTPDYRLGCKRILLADDFYPALTRPNVEVVTAPLRELRAGALVTADGVERPLDTLICATGFRVTPAPFAARVRGRDGHTLADRWRDGEEAHLGTTVAGFPNLFLLLGPNTGLGHSSMLLMIESQVAYIVATLRALARRGATTVEVRPEAQARSNAALQRRMARTIWLSGCRSWYLDARGRNTTLWPGFTWEYRLRTRRFDADNYELRERRAG